MLEVSGPITILNVLIDIKQILKECVKISNL